MSLQVEQPKEITDKVLSRALMQFYEYDQAALKAKTDFRQGRWIVLILVTLGSIAALLTSYSVDGTVLALVTGGAAIILPILAGTLIGDIQTYSKPTTWLTFRLIAERLRSQIWLYRMSGGEYASIPLQARNDKLNEEIRDKNISVGTQNNITIGQENPGVTVLPNSDQLVRTNWDYVVQSFRPGDDTITLEEYLDVRAIQQKNWYDVVIGRQARTLRRLNRAAQLILFFGAIFPPLVFLTGAPIGLIAIVSITNIISFSITTWTNVVSFGRTVGIFRITREELNYLLGKWESFQDDVASHDDAKRLQFQIQLVKEVEDTLAWEREKWYEASFQSIPSVDEAFFKAVEELQVGEKYKGSTFDTLPSKREDNK